MTSFEPYSVHGLFTEEVVEILYNTDFLLKVLSVTYLLFDIFGLFLKFSAAFILHFLILQALFHQGLYVFHQALKAEFKCFSSFLYKSQIEVLFPIDIYLVLLLVTYIWMMQFPFTLCLDKEPRAKPVHQSKILLNQK